MNDDKAAGTFDKIKGKIKQGVGEAVGNEKMANSGAADQVKGAAKQTWGSAKDAVNDTANRGKAESDAHASHTRNKIVDTAENVKDRVTSKVDKHRS